MKKICFCGFKGFKDGWSGEEMLRRTCHVCIQKHNLYVKEGVPVNWCFFWLKCAISYLGQSWQFLEGIRTDVFSSKMWHIVVIMIARKFQSKDHDSMQKMPCFVRFENAVSRNGCQRWWILLFVQCFGAKIIKGFFSQVGNYNQGLWQCNIWLRMHLAR